MASSARIDELRKKFDENPRRYFAPLANEYRKSGDLEQAIFICQEYLPQQPGHMSGHIVYGQALYELSRFDEARAVFETALSLDPENLIALRHLGDIARQSGDSRGARAWYQRVLEADPRNEEIAQIMMTLLATPDESVAAVSSPPTVGSTPTLEMPVRSPTPMQGTPAVSGSAFENAPELSSLRPTPSEPPPLPPTSTWGETDKSVADQDLLDIEDFSVGGVALSSLGAPPPEIDSPPPLPPQSELSSERASVDEDAVEFEATGVLAEPVTPGGFDLGNEDGPFEADPLAIAAAHDPTTAATAATDEAPIELASDVELGLSNDGEAATTFSESTGERLADLETFGEPIVPPASEPSGLEVDTYFVGLAHEPLVEAEGDSLPLVSNRAETPRSIGAIETPDSFDSGAPLAMGTPESAKPVTATPFENADFIERAPEAVFEISGSMDAKSDQAFESSALIDIGDPVERSEPVESEPAAAMADAPWDDTPPPIPSDTPVLIEVIAPAVVWVPPEPPPTVPASEEFVTETMAELYLEQGHLEAAVDIYERLVAQRPDEPELAERLHAVEATLRGELTNHSSDVVFEPEPTAGPTIRDFLASFLGYAGFAPAPAAISEPEPDAFSSFETPISTPRVETPVSPPRVPTPAYSAAVEPPRMATPNFGLPTVESQQSSLDEAIGAVDDMDFDLTAPSGTTPMAPTPAVPSVSVDAPTVQIPLRSPVARGTPAGSSETVSGSIDALFTGANASSADSDAAATLSQAFAADVPEPAPAKLLKGVPAHAASSELSLDHVFKTTPARRQETESDGFSFDQFFAEELSEGAAKGGAEPPIASDKAESGGGTGDDIARFNNWLNGLKKT